MKTLSVRIIALFLSCLMTIMSAPLAIFADEMAAHDHDHDEDAHVTDTQTSSSTVGDLDHDGSINAKDTINLFRYVAGWDVDADEADMDVDGNGHVNAKDAILLFRYVAGWDVEIGPGTDAPETEPSYPETEPDEPETDPDEPETDPDEPPHQHVPVQDPAKEATCNESGLTEGSHCAECGFIIEEQTAIPALGHAGHLILSVDATCEYDGYDLYRCDRCGEEYVSNYTFAFEHILGDMVVIQEYSCITDGIYHQYCMNDGCAYYRQIVDHYPGHRYAAQSREENGQVIFVCMACEHTKIAEAVLDANSNDEAYATNCSPYFVFDVVSTRNEAYVRAHLTVTDLFFKNNDSEYADYANVGYTLTSLGNGVWRVTASNPFEAGGSYEVLLSGELSFTEYKGSKLVIDIAKEEKEEIE